MTLFQEMITYYCELLADLLMSPPFSYFFVLILGLFILKLISYIMHWR